MVHVRSKRLVCLSHKSQTMTPSELRNAAKLLTLLRMNVRNGQVGLLTVEALLLLATGPKTMAELQKQTGADNGNLSRAVRTLLPWFDRKAGVVVTPDLPLLKRVKRPGRKAPVLSLSRMGCLTLRECGLLPDRGCS